MNISRLWTCALNSAALAFILAMGPGAAGEKPVASKLRPFLQEFNDRKEPTIKAQMIQLPSVSGPISAYFARPETGEILPTVMIVSSKDGLTPWMKQNARELSSIGYAVLAMEAATGPAADEKAQAELFAALRWLRQQPDIAPDRLGIVGWGTGATPALQLAASFPVQACVICESLPVISERIRTGLRGVQVLVLVPDKGQQKAIASMRRSLAETHIAHKVVVFPNVAAGFMGPPGTPPYHEQSAEEAWVHLYEFLDIHVEDAGVDRRVTGKESSIAGIADLMRAVNQPNGVRGALRESLKQKPKTFQHWRQARAQAAVLAEASGLLRNLKPPHGHHARWQKHTDAFRRSAEEVVNAIDRRDYAKSLTALQLVEQQCAACHRDHRVAK
jgi:dienelactone hydrolase